MAEFKNIIGHEQIIEHLQNAILLEKVSHAYIFNGPEYAGKMMLAEAFATALQCEKKGWKAVWNVVPVNKPPIITSRILFIYFTKSRIRFL